MLKAIWRLCALAVLKRRVERLALECCIKIDVREGISPDPIGEAEAIREVGLRIALAGYSRSSFSRIQDRVTIIRSTISDYIHDKTTLKSDTDLLTYILYSELSLDYLDTCLSLTQA